MLQRRGRRVIFGICLGVLRFVAVLRWLARLSERVSKSTVTPALRINVVQELHDTLHHVLVVDDRLLQSDDFLQQHGVVDAELVVAVLQTRQLRLGRHQLRVHEVDLLRGPDHVFRRRYRLAWRRSLAADIVEGILVVRLEIGVLKFPGLAKASITMTCWMFQYFGLVSIEMSHLHPRRRATVHSLRCCVGLYGSHIC